MKEERNSSIIKQKAKLFFSILIIQFTLVNSQNKRTDSDQLCIQKNDNWDFMTSNKNMIPDPQSCTDIAVDCCHITVEYNYNGELYFNNSYCYSMSGQIENWVAKFTNFYSDELMWFANYTNDNFDNFKSIGKNLNYDIFENYTCTETHPPQDYSDYYISVCAKFNEDGTCGIINNDTYFNEFMDVMYNNVTEGHCNNIDPDTGKCRLYTEFENKTALEPLLDLLKHSLGIEVEKRELTGNIEENLKAIFNEKKRNADQDETQINKRKLETQTETVTECKPVPKVTVKVVCSEKYSSGVFIHFNLISLLLLFLALY